VIHSAWHRPSAPADRDAINANSEARDRSMAATTEASTATVAVIVLTVNQRDTTARCLGSLMAADQPTPHVIVWDNGSQDGTAEAIRAAFPEVLVHHHPSNLGVASGRNAAAALAMEAFNPSYLLFLDNDMLLERGFVSALLQPLQTQNRVGQTQAKLRFMHDRQRINDGGGCQINFTLGRTRPVGFGELDRGQYDTPKPCVACGGAMMVLASIFNQLGGFDSLFDPFGPEDLDFSLRLVKAGYQALYVPQAVAYHQVSHSFGQDYSENYARHKSRHWLAFLQRHASPLEKLGFFVIGAPYVLVRGILREGRRGNLGAMRGWLRGVSEAVRGALIPTDWGGRR
jgi:GT2 family glycosyltransferase